MVFKYSKRLHFQHEKQATKLQKKRVKLINNNHVRITLN